MVYCCYRSAESLTLLPFAMLTNSRTLLQLLRSAQRVDATDLPALEFSRRAYKLVCLASGSPRLARQLVPYPRNKVVLERDFELFFPMFTISYELYSLTTIPNWRQRCRKAACFITEVWSDTVAGISVRAPIRFRPHLHWVQSQRSGRSAHHRSTVHLPAARR